MVDDYVPERGDIVWLLFNPQAGHEQAGRRPALILSPAAYNGKVDLAIVCLVTRQVKGYPFEVPLPAGLDVDGVVLADQVKSLDWRARDATYMGHVSPAVVSKVLGKLRLLLAD